MGIVGSLLAGRLRRDTLLLLAMHTYYKLTGVVLLMLVSRKLGSAEIGLYFFSISFAESFNILADFSLDPVLMRRVAAKPEEAGRRLASLLGFRLLSSPVYLVIVTAAALAFTGAKWQVIGIVALFTLFEDIYASFGAFFVAVRRVPLNVAISIGVQTIFLAAVATGLEASPSLMMLLAASLFRTVVLVVSALFVTHRLLVPLRLGWDTDFVKSGVPFLLTSFLNNVREKLGTLLLGFLGTYAVVGHYQLAYRVLFAAFFVPSAVGTAFFPHLAAEGLSAQNRLIFLRAASGLAVFGVLGAVAVYVLARPVVSLLYGPLAGEVVPLLRGLVPLLPLRFLEKQMTSALQALHQETAVLRTLLVSTAAGLALGFVLIPPMGAHGAIQAQILSALLRLGMLAWCMRTQFLLARASSLC